MRRLPILWKPCPRDARGFLGNIFPSTHTDLFRHEGETLVKRIVAVGGDTVSLNDQDGSFAVNQELATATRILIVPKDYFFVVGDNRQNSFDSRFWEEPFVGVKWVLARVRA